MNSNGLDHIDSSYVMSQGTCIWNEPVMIEVPVRINDKYLYPKRRSLNLIYHYSHRKIIKTLKYIYHKTSIVMNYSIRDPTWLRHWTLQVHEHTVHTLNHLTLNNIDRVLDYIHTVDIFYKSNIFFNIYLIKTTGSTAVVNLCCYRRILFFYCLCGYVLYCMYVYSMCLCPFIYSEVICLESKESTKNLFNAQWWNSLSYFLVWSVPNCLHIRK